MTTWTIYTLIAAIFFANQATPSLPNCEGSLCGFDRPEDLTRLPGTDWMLASQQSPDQPLVLFNLQDPASRLTISEHNASSHPAFPCSGAPITIVPRGHTIGTLYGDHYVALINAVDTARIELFKLVFEGSIPSLRWSSCIAVDPALALNDVAIGPDNRLYASHMFDPTNPPSDLVAAFKQRHVTGYGVQWKAGDGWSKLPGTDLSFANGIAISGNGETLALAGTYSQQMLLLYLETGAVTRTDLPIQPDNISALGASDFITVGHTGVPIDGIAACRLPEAFPCGFPFAVAAFGQSVVPQILFRHDGTGIPGASVVIYLDDEDAFLLGSAFGDRITRVAAPKKTRRNR